MTQGVVVRNRWHAFIEWALPWFDREAEDARNLRTEVIRRKAIAARVRSEQVTAAYLDVAARMRR